MNTPKKPLRRPFVFGQTPPLNTPLFPNVAFRSKTPDQMDAVYDNMVAGATYAREGHPNAEHVAHIINEMEQAEAGWITASGMGAISVGILGLLKSGDHLIANEHLYGGTLSLFKKQLGRLGIEVTFVDLGECDNFVKAVRANTKMVFTETIANPTMRVADLDGIIQHAQKKSILVAIDNTFTTPIGYQPLVASADITIHSVTKMLAGHSDTMLGYIGVRNPEHICPLYDALTTMGMTPSPFDCWLAERGLLSFSLRYARSQENAKALSAYLTTLAGVKNVYYPGLESHPDYAKSQKLFGTESGTMIGVEIEGGREVANQFFEAISPIRFVPTLGDITTTLSHPLSTSHRSLSPEEATALGLSEGFFRISVGIEDIDFLKSCFTHALRVAMGEKT